MAAFGNNLQLGAGIYTYPDIAHVLGIPYHKVQRWINQYWEGALGKEFERRYTWNVDGTKAVSFHTMIELFIFHQLNEAGVRPKDILQAHKQLAGMYHTAFPFATKEVLQGLRSDGKQVLLKLKDGTVLSLNGSRQFNMPFVLEFMRKLTFNEDLVSQYWPMGKGSSIVCDPKHQFGHAVVAGTNILPQVLANMRRGGDSIKLIAFNYSLDPKQVKDAITFVDRLKEAA
ncbi:MAG: DUF433 domain-containing protein [Flavobacteriales bacterium]|nr:DUF433 domain-containing protein [Flavobacteriales bacterium]